MNLLLLFDAAPEPISTGIGIAAMVFVAVVVLMITASVLLGAVFLFRRIKRTVERPSQIVADDVSLNLDGGGTQTNPQTETTS